MPITDGQGWNRGLTLPPEPLTTDEARRLVYAPSKRAPSGVRNRALLALLWRSALRSSEACTLAVADVDLAAGRVRVLHGKGDRMRVVPLDAGAGDLVSAWLETRRALRVPAKAPLFCSISRGSKGRPVSARYVRSMVKRLAERVGIERRVHPHGLRHTRALELLDEGAPLRVIQRLLGHRRPSTTDEYLRRIGGRAPGEIDWESPDWREGAG
jgi:site-specific recombinase XerD